MVFESKLYFTGVETRHSNKTGKDYTVLKLFDFDSNSTFELFCSSPEAFKDFKPMSQYNFKLQVTKQNNFISLNLVE